MFSVVVFAEKAVRNEPAKSRFPFEASEAMERTSALAPSKPLKGGADQVFVFALQTATEEPGDEKLPPTQRFLALVSQCRAVIGPFGPLEPRAENPPNDENDAT